MSSEDVIFYGACIAVLVGLPLAAILCAEILRRLNGWTIMTMGICTSFIAVVLVFAPAPLPFVGQFPEGCSGVLLKFSNEWVAAGCRAEDGRYVLWDNQGQTLRDLPEEYEASVVRVYQSWEVTLYVQSRYHRSLRNGTRFRIRQEQDDEGRIVRV